MTNKNHQQEILQLETHPFQLFFYVFLWAVEWRPEKRCGWNTLELARHAYAVSDHEKNAKNNFSLQTLPMLRPAQL